MLILEVLCPDHDKITPTDNQPSTDSDLHKLVIFQGTQVGLVVDENGCHGHKLSKNAS